MRKIIVAIDPDVNKSGFAFLEVKTRILTTVALPFPELLDHLLHVRAAYRDQVIVLVEKSWNTSHNWHTKPGESWKVSAAKGNSTGRNHEVGRKIVEMCKHYGLEVVEKTPLKKCWSGPEGKITHKELSYFTGLEGRTNQEERDAALIAWNYAGLPIIINVKSKKKRSL